VMQGEAQRERSRFVQGDGLGAPCVAM
jgi:hypothetical protein